MKNTQELKDYKIMINYIIMDLNTHVPDKNEWTLSLIYYSEVSVTHTLYVIL
jgi:hypothetical protein